MNGCSTKIVRTWTIVDWCTKEETTCMQAIYVVDTLAPVISEQCPDGDTLRITVNDGMGQCEAIFPVINYSAADECVSRINVEENISG